MILVLRGKLLESTSHSSVRVEVLANRTLRREWASDLLSNTTDVSVLGELTADGAVLAED